MNDQSNLAGIGHNEGPLLDAKIQLRATELEAGIDRFLETVETIDDEETAAKTQGFIKQIADCLKDIEADRKGKKEPYLEAGRKIDDAAKTLKAGLEMGGLKVKNRLNDYLRREEEKKREIERQKAEEARKAREEAERAAREAEEAANVEAMKKAAEAQRQAKEAEKAAKAAEKDKAAVKHESSDRATGLRRKKVAVVTDFEAALAHFTSHPRIREAVEACAADVAKTIPMSSAKDGMELAPGVTLRLEV